MCTVTFLPLSNQNFILTSNRDEDVNRAQALPVAQYQHYDTNIFYPKDGKANGTWIAASTTGITLCLLNGAFVKHSFGQTYRISRGIVLLDFFKYNDVMDYTQSYNFDNIEPFTMVIVDNRQDMLQLHEMRWDGNTMHVKQMDAMLTHIWSSVTLYSAEIIKQRENWFESWLQTNNDFTPENILMFHHFGGDGDKNSDLVMNRGFVKTVSITCIHKTNAGSEIIYEDVIQKKLHRNLVI
ncbi:MAG: NRDE family protein [Bacteroidetes bacterium]|nr:NRDE family protein [Bacteroidota bacterium]